MMNNRPDLSYNCDGGYPDLAMIDDELKAVYKENQERLDKVYEELTELLEAFTGLSLTRIQYTDILQFMPDNCWMTLIKLWDYLDPECIDAVLERVDPRVANILMLDCLIKRHTADISGFCDILVSIPNTTYELSSIVESLRGALDVASENAENFKRELKICIMGDINDQNNELVAGLIESGYENIHEYESTETVAVAEFKDFEVWILLPPNEQTGSGYMTALFNNLQNALSDNKLKLAIYSDLNQLRTLCNLYGLNALVSQFDDALESLRNRPGNKLMVKNINENFQNNLISSLNAEVLPFFIQKKFVEIVGTPGIIMVITMGKEVDLDFNILWEKYTGNFRRHGSCHFPPTMVAFTNEEGEKLKNSNVTWTHNSPAVEKEVNMFLKKKQPFIFYRNGSFSGVNMDSKEALNVIFREICWDHHLLIVGDDSGLKEELEKDIQIVAALAGLSDGEFQGLCSSVQNSFGRSYGKKGVFTLLIIPNRSLLKAKLQECILKCANSKLTIIYSGHNAKEVGWALAGGDRFSGSDLKQILSDVKPQHYPEINILLNCCYGLAFAKEIGDAKTLLSCLEIDSELSKKVKEKISGDTYSVLPESENEMHEWLKDNDCITQAMCEIAKKSLYRASIINDLPYRVSVVPFSIGPLPAQGILSKEMVKNNYTKIDWSKLPRTLPKKLQSYSEVSDPRFFVFAAGNGDSTLFCWHDFNMLVDGGIYTAPPCFWRTVHRLPQNQKLDVVVVTHYDEDHIAGILRLFQEDPLPIAIGELYSTEPPPNVTGTRSAKQGTELWKLAERRCNRMTLVCDPTKAVITKEFNGDHRLRIFMLTPTKEKLKKAAEKMAKYRGLSIPNQASASLLIECKIETNYKYALLTGDAPGVAIIEGLDQLKEADEEVKKYCYKGDRYCFDYIDMPHHGSRHNDPECFLSKLSSVVCVVSTDGKSHNHPDVETLCELNQAMDRSIKYLLFTYCDKRPTKTGHRIISELKDSGRNVFSEKNKRSLCFADNNPEDKDCKQCLLVSLTAPPEFKKWNIM